MTASSSAQRRHEWPLCWQQLAQQGKRVLMVEAHSIPGGYTTNFYRKGFRFEISTHVMNGW
ncbi:hypothetical protein QTG54_012205 [Skeletonema marinoi]|uniref:Uncharacterized protein n=1 Tax=Skeletonema marinoi TaxID=267567 RepID=A0AAD9D975_9STRA|nr:hypothetical protein QTG54_012205 [Skeletonema marinoi]